MQKESTVSLLMKWAWVRCTCFEYVGVYFASLPLNSGKTLQTISFFVHLNYSMAHEPIYGRRAHLVVVPLSVLFNWAMELRRFCPQLRALRVHTNSAKEQQRLRQILSTFSNTSQRPQYDVVITTYEMVKGKMENSFRRVMWRSMVLDEGHRIKNEMTDIYRACMLFKARFKLVLTGEWA